MKIIITDNNFTIEDASIYDVVCALAASYAKCFSTCKNDQQKEVLAKMILDAVLKAVDLGLNGSSDSDRMDKQEVYDVSMIAKMMQKMQDEQEG